MSEINIVMNKRRLSELRLGSPRSVSIDEMDVDSITLGNNTIFSQRDVQVVSQSVSYMNPFLAKRANEKQQLVFMREILASGEITSMEIYCRQHY